MAAQDVVLDEIQWRAPDLVQFMGGIHENTGLSIFHPAACIMITNSESTSLFCPVALL